MTPENFVYWLQGKVELHPECPTEEQWESIVEHLKLVFKKETPPLKLSELGELFKDRKDLVEDFNKWEVQNPKYPPLYKKSEPTTPPTIIC